MARRMRPWNVELANWPPAELPPLESLADPPVRPLSDPHPALPYENLAFEGGGIKGIAYVGALEVLEEKGLYPQHIHRVSGASSGSFLAAMVAVGYSSADLQKMMVDTNLSSVMQDARLGLVTGVFNMVTVYGLNPGQRLLDYLGEQLKARTGSADVTFHQLLERCGRELCVPVTNVSRMATEYCHPKTTPDMPVRLAVGMSMSLPVLMVPYRLVRGTDELQTSELYTDGGLLCNYPVHAFDGWWLSLKPGDTFLQRLRPLSEVSEQMHDHVRFAERNPRTLGFTVFEQAELDASMRWVVPDGGPPARPDTALARSRREREATVAAQSRMVQAVGRAAERLVEALARVETDGDGLVSRDEAERMFDEGGLSGHDATLLFGTTDVESVFRQLDHNGDGRVSYHEVLRFVDRTNAPWTAHLGLSAPQPTSVTSFMSIMFQAVWAHMRKVTLHPEDRYRTIPIDTDYVSTADFHLEARDQEFLLESGRRAARAFLRARREG